MKWFGMVIALMLAASGAHADPYPVEYRGAIVGFPYVQIIDAVDGSPDPVYRIRLCRTDPCDEGASIFAWPSQQGPGFILSANSGDWARMNPQILQEAVDKVRTRQHRITPDF